MTNLICSKKVKKINQQKSARMSIKHEVKKRLISKNRIMVNEDNMKLNFTNAKSLHVYDFII